MSQPFLNFQVFQHSVALRKRLRQKRKLPLKGSSKFLRRMDASSLSHYRLSSLAVKHG